MLYVFTTNAQDLTIPILEEGMHFLGDQKRLQKACSHVREKKNMNASNAAALTLWLGLCQKKLIQKNSLSTQMFAYKSGSYYFPLPNGQPNLSTPATYEDMVLQFYSQFGSPILNRLLSDRTLSIMATQFPLIMFGANSASNTINVWTNFDINMPIPSLLNEPDGRELFCQSAVLPRDEYILSDQKGYSLAGCSIESDENLEDDTLVTIPDFPPVPAGKSPSQKTRNAECHQLRISAAKLGKISSDDLFKWTDQNLVPVFSKVGDPHSDLLGTDPCNK
jgi:hypothetical protein